MNSLLVNLQVVKLSSPALNYDKPHRWLHERFNRKLPAKIGSLQLFVTGFKVLVLVDICGWQ